MAQQVDRQSFTVTNISNAIFDPEISSSYNFKRFIKGSTFFSDFYKCGRTLYNKTGKLVYKFERSKIVAIPEETITHENLWTHTLDCETSYYLLWCNRLYEFLLYEKSSEPNSIYKIHVWRTVFDNISGEVVETACDFIPYEYDIEPYIVNVDGYVIVSKKYDLVMSDTKYEWLITMENDLPFAQNDRVIIYNVEQGSYLAIHGVTTSEVFSNHFCIVFNGIQWLLIDIKTGKSKFDVDANVVSRDELTICVKRLMTGLTIPNDRISYEKRRRDYFIDEIFSKKKDNKWIAKHSIRHEIKVMEYFVDDTLGTEKYQVSNYVINKDDVYNPDPDECAKCYCQIDRDYVIVPCGNRTHCERCAANLVETSSACTKCGVVATSVVKILD